MSNGDPSSEQSGATPKDTGATPKTTGAEPSDGDRRPEDMTVGDSRQVTVPVKVTEGAKKWLPDPDGVKTLYVEIRLVSLERAE